MNDSDHTASVPAASYVDEIEEGVSGTRRASSAAQQARTLAVSAGDHRVAVMREVHRSLAEGDQLQAANAGIDRLVRARLITDQDRESIEQICGHVFASQKGDSPSEVAFAHVRVIYDRMLLDTSSSPVALAIASIASSGSTPAIPDDPDRPDPVVRAMGRSDQVDMGIVGGAVSGAVVGGLLGGPGGAIVGGVIGGIAGGVGTACAT
jgi:hypothetical protein